MAIAADEEPEDYSNAPAKSKAAQELRCEGG
jgi:hypothetical protein